MFAGLYQELILILNNVLIHQKWKTILEPFILQLPFLYFILKSSLGLVQRFICNGVHHIVVYDDERKKEMT